MIYLVDQTLTKKQTVMVEAVNKDEAVERARDGHGEVIDQDGRWHLLCSDAEMADRA